AASNEFRLTSPGKDHERRLTRKYMLEVTKSLALAVQDIDAPEPKYPIVLWTHGLVVNIQPEVDVAMHDPSFKFKPYALDDETHLGNKVTKEKLLETIDG
ncbi:unnamed protein product, partial [Prunus brigantina]